MKYYYRKTDKDFREWCSMGLFISKQFIEKYEKSNNLEFLYLNKKDYKYCLGFINKYSVLQSSLNSKQKEILQAIYDNTLNKNLFNAFDYNEIYNNWIEICFTNNKSLKELNNKMFGNNLRIQRLKKKMTIVEVAELIGVDQSTIRKYELGYQFPRIDVLYKLIQIYKIKLEDIME